MKLKNIFKILIASLAMSAGLSNCGESGSGAGLAIKIYYPISKDPSVLRDTLPEPGVVPAGISDFKICIFTQDANNPLCKNFNVADYNRTKKARIDDIPVGSERSVHFQGYSSGSGEVKWCGEINGIEIKKDETTKIKLFITGCRRFTELDSSLNSPRVFHTATKLPDGRVLIVGGFSETQCTGTDCFLSPGDGVTDIYDPLQGTIEHSSALALKHKRGFHSATLLDDGRVLIAGGAQRVKWDNSFTLKPVVQLMSSGDWGLPGTTAEILDPVAQTTSVVNLPKPLAHHGSMPLRGGGALLFGGMALGGSAQNLVLRFDPASNSVLEESAKLQELRQGMTVVVTRDAQRAVVWGGNETHAAQDPENFIEYIEVDDQGGISTRIPTFASSPGDLPYKSRPRPSFYSAGAQLLSGEILIGGGMLVSSIFTGEGTPVAIDLSWLVNMEPSTVRGFPGLQMNNYHVFHTATMLPHSATNGEVVLAGGITIFGKSYLTSKMVEFFYPTDLASENDSRYPTEEPRLELTKPRAGHTATLLDDGTVLFTGGFTVIPTDIAGEIVSDLEIFNPSPRKM